MPENIPVVHSKEGEAEFYRAYDEVLNQWLIPYIEQLIPTRFRTTHIVSSGPVEAEPVLSLHAAGGGAAVWSQNLGPLGE
jgi:hypothetical protein